MLKKTILAALAGTALLASNAAFADRDHYRRHGNKHYQGHNRHVEYRPVVRHHYQRPVYYHPAPVYYQRVDPNAGLVVAGALIGGAIAWHIVNSY
jgi:hypothetical protein